MHKPDDLSEKASVFWDDISSTYSLRVDEWHILLSACRTMTEIERMENALSDEPVMTKGSRGQVVGHPLLAEVARHRTMLARLLKQLDLPDVTTGRSALSEKRSRAANSRWNRVRAEQAGTL